MSLVQTARVSGTLGGIGRSHSGSRSLEVWRSHGAHLRAGLRLFAAAIGIMPRQVCARRVHCACQGPADSYNTVSIEGPNRNSSDIPLLGFKPGDPGT